MITQTYNLDLVPNGPDVIVKCSQYDRESRTITFNMYSNSELYAVPSGATVTVRGTKSDNTGFEYPCEHEGNTVSFDIKEQMTVFNGKVLCEIRITLGGEILGTANFILFVERTALSDDTVISETDLPLVQKAADVADELDSIIEAIDKVTPLVPDGEGTAGQFLQKTNSGTTWSNVNSAEWGNITGTLADQTDLQTALDGKVSKSGDSMTGILNTNSDIKFTAKNKGLWALDSTSFSYPLVYDNGANLWIGAVKTASQHHNGETIISTGYNGTSGNETISVVVPNATNDDGTSYKVWHEGNYERYYSTGTINNSVTVNDFISSGLISSGQKGIQFYVPYPVLSGTASISSLSLVIRSVEGNYPRFRSGTNGSTYTQIGSSRTSIITNGSPTRDNEISSVAVYVKRASGFSIALNLVYQVCADTQGTPILNNQPLVITGVVTFKLS